jgi:hypothetical protein
MTWDGTRWLEERPPSPAVRRTGLADWLATLIMVFALVAMTLPLVMVRAAARELTLSPTSAPAGTVVAARMVGMGKNVHVQLQWDGSPAAMPSGTTTSAGAITLRFVVPAASEGRHSVSIVQTALEDARGTGNGRKLAVSSTLATSPFIVLSAAALATVSPSPSPSLTTPAPTPVPATPAPTPVPATPAPTPVPATPAPTPVPATPAPPPPTVFTGSRPAMPGGAIWADSFDGSALNASKWGWDMAMVGTSDNMNRYAMFSTDPRLLEVSNGSLKLKGLRLADGSWLQSYISTRGKYTQQYGIFRASMRIPAGHALWPAFWMLDPTRYDEMDVIEAYPEPGNARYTFCMLNTAGRPCAGIALPADFSSSFHVYEMEWRPGVAIARLDGVEVARHAIPEMRPQFMLLQMAVGVWFRNYAPDGTTPTNPALEVDWVATWP